MSPRRWENFTLSIPALPGGFTDHVVSSPGGVELGVRVWPSVQGFDGPRPFLLWFHGGSTVLGTPYSFSPWAIPEFTKRGFHVVSAGYRLCPQASLEDQLIDCLGALAWCRERMGNAVGRSVDADRWVVGGESAGARLSTLLALRATPPPKVVLDIYGHTTYYPQHVLDPLPPSEFEWPATLPPLEEVLELVNCHNPSRAIVHAPYSAATEAALREEWSFPAFVLDDRVKLQMATNRYYNLSKSKNYHALRLDEFPEPQARQAQIDKYSLLSLLDDADSYPPTVILQGTADTFVDPQMSRDLEAKLKRRGVPVLALYEEGAPHGFDFVFTSPEVEDYDKFITATMKFVEAHI